MRVGVPLGVALLLVAGPASADGLTLRWRAAIAADSSTLPSPAGGGAASIAWTPGRARFELGGSLWAGQSRTTGGAAAGAKLSLASAGLRGCYAILRSDLEIAPCAGADALF